MQVVLTMRVVGGDNATKGSCKSNNENQHEIYSSQIPETRRSSSLINARLTWWKLEVKGACMHGKDIASRIVRTGSIRPLST